VAKLPGEERRRRPVLLIVAAVLIAAYFLIGDRVGEIDIETVLEDLSDNLGDWTYLLVGFLAFVETGAFVGLVFPGETAVILGGAVAGQGDLSITLMLGIVWLCAWGGDSVSFLIGNRLGREFVLRHGPKVRITRERFAQVENYFQRYGGRTILIGRFIGLVRALAPFIAGSSGMRYRAFLPFSVLGTGLWAATFTLLGFVVSESINKAGEIAGRGTLIFGTVVAVTVAVVITVRTLRDPERRARLVAAMEENAALRPLLALGRRLEPQWRFVRGRLTPGGLGLEFTAAFAILAVSVYVVVLYTVVVTGDSGPTPGDKAAFDIVRDLRSGWLTDLNDAVTVLGSSAVTIPLAAVAGLVLAVARRWAELTVLVIAVGLTHVGIGVMKEAVDRPRPELFAGSDDLGSSAFPSGHAAYSVIYPWLALTITVRLRRRLAHGTALVIVGFAFAAAIGLSRVYLGVHYLSDVSAGWALGVAAFALCAAIAFLAAHIRQNASARTGPARAPSG
jgi:membrane protein DedA with SNARE-associated domain/membrane-associated phospholipid phosphatase